MGWATACLKGGEPQICTGRVCKRAPNVLGLRRPRDLVISHRNFSKFRLFFTAFLHLKVVVSKILLKPGSLKRQVFVHLKDCFMKRHTMCQRGRRGGPIPATLSLDSILDDIQSEPKLSDITVIVYNLNFTLTRGLFLCIIYFTLNLGDNLTLHQLKVPLAILLYLTWLLVVTRAKWQVFGWNAIAVNCHSNVGKVPWCWKDGKNQLSWEHNIRSLTSVQTDYTLIKYGCSHSAILNGVSGDRTQHFQTKIFSTEVQ